MVLMGSLRVKLCASSTPIQKRRVSQCITLRNHHQTIHSCERTTSFIALNITNIKREFIKTQRPKNRFQQAATHCPDPYATRFHSNSYRRSHTSCKKALPKAPKMNILVARALRRRDLTSTVRYIEHSHIRHTHSHTPNFTAALNRRTLTSLLGLQW